MCGKLADGCALLVAVAVCKNAYGDQNQSRRRNPNARVTARRFALRFFVIRHGVIPASRGGKAKTLLQNVAIGLYILPLTGWAASARWWLMAAAVVITVVTGAAAASIAAGLQFPGVAAQQQGAQAIERLRRCDAEPVRV